MSEMPFVVDNRGRTMQEILQRLLLQYQGCELDVAVGSFALGGWQLARWGLKQAGSLRLLLGSGPVIEMDCGGHKVEETKSSRTARIGRLAGDLATFLEREQVEVRCAASGFAQMGTYLLSRDGAPLVGIAGSSALTLAGLLGNRGMNLVYRADFGPFEIKPELVEGVMAEYERLALRELEPRQLHAAARVPGRLALRELSTWFRTQWREAHDCKKELLVSVSSSESVFRLGQVAHPFEL